jgi:hypothetical protein
MAPDARSRTGAAFAVPAAAGRDARAAASAQSGWAWMALGVLLIAGTVLLIYETRGTTFRDDEWNWIFNRRGGSLSTYLAPYNLHLELVPIAIYKLLFVLVGMRSYVPYRAVGIAAHLACVAVLFVYARPRVGGFFAVLAAALILLFGPGWEAFLWPINMSFVIAITAGISALIMLDRGDRSGEVAAAVLLLVSLASDDVGIAVAVGLVVDVVQRRRWRDLWIVAAPIVVYAVWWLADQQAISPSPVSAVARFVWRTAAGVMSSLAGLSGSDAVANAGSPLTWGRPLLVIAVLLLIWRLWHQRRIPARLVTLLAMLLCFWITVGIGRAGLRIGPLVLAATGFEPRYLYIGAVLVMLIIVEALRGVRPARWARPAVGVLGLAAIISNLGSLSDGAEYQRDTATLTKASLGTIEITRSIVSPDFAPAGFAFSIVKAGEYFAAVRALGGSPAATAAQIASDPETTREFVDSQLTQIHHVTLQTGAAGAPLRGPAPTIDTATNGVAHRNGACVTYRSTPASSRRGALVLTLARDGLLIRTAGSTVGVALRRFADMFAPLGTAAARSSTALRISPDRAPQAWRVRLITSADITACTLR